MKVASLFFLAFLVLAGCGEERQEPAKGWKYSFNLKRDFMPDALRMKSDPSAISEYRWVAKPSGDFGERIDKFLAPQSFSMKDAKDHGTVNNIPFTTKYIGVSYAMVFRVLVAFDRTSSSFDALTSKEALDELYAGLQAKLDSFPTADIMENKNWLPVYGNDLNKQVPSAYLVPEFGAAGYDQNPDYVPRFAAFVEPVIRQWQGNHGSAYTGSPNVIRSILFWYDYVPMTTLTPYLETAQAQFAKQNETDGKPLRRLDPRPSLPAH